jgi:hypothetical protein
MRHFTVSLGWPLGFLNQPYAELREVVVEEVGEVV